LARPVEAGPAAFVEAALPPASEADLVGGLLGLAERGRSPARGQVGNQPVVHFLSEVLLGAGEPEVHRGGPDGYGTCASRPSTTRRVTTGSLPGGRRPGGAADRPSHVTLLAHRRRNSGLLSLARALLTAPKSPPWKGATHDPSRIYRRSRSRHRPACRRPDGSRPGTAHRSNRHQPECLQRNAERLSGPR